MHTLPLVATCAAPIRGPGREPDLRALLLTRMGISIEALTAVPAWGWRERSNLRYRATRQLDMGVCGQRREVY